MSPIQTIKPHSVLIEAHNNYKRELGLYACSKLQDRERSEDLVQDTFMKTWNYIVNGGEIEIMKAFLYHVLNHLIVDEYRKNKTTSLDVLLERGFEPSVIDGSVNISNILDGREAILLIAQLPFMYRKVIHMRYAQGLSLKEMSSITGQTKNTLSVQVHRGLEKLKLLYNC